jgi:hypothetical protein
MELRQVEQLLEGEKMKIKDYLRLLYPDRTKRTIDRKRRMYAELSASIPPAVLKRLGRAGSDLREQYERIATAAIGDIRNAVRELPALTANTDREAGKYLEQLNAKLFEDRQVKRAGGKRAASLDEKDCAKMATVSVLKYLRFSHLKTSQQKIKFLARVVGWVMHEEAIAGTMRAGRITTPEGIIVPRGRPRKTPKKAA